MNDELEKKIIRCLEENYGEPMELEDLARQLGMLKTKVVFEIQGNLREELWRLASNGVLEFTMDWKVKKA